MEFRKGKPAVISVLRLWVNLESEYSKSIQEFIAPVMINPKSMKVNKFGKKFKRYAEAVKLYT